MEKEMTGAERRKALLAMMRETEKPLSGTALGKRTGVSRQVVVQDMALLRTEGYPIISTARGYLMKHRKDAPDCLKYVTPMSRWKMNLPQLLIWAVRW